MRTTAPRAYHSDRARENPESFTATSADPQIGTSWVVFYISMAEPQETCEVPDRRRGFPGRGDLRGPGSVPRISGERELARSGIAAEDFRGEDEFQVIFFRRRLRRRLRRTTCPHYSPTQSGAKLSANQRSGRGPKSEDFGTRFGPARGDSRGSFWMEWLRNQFWTRLRKLFSIPT